MELDRSKLTKAERESLLRSGGCSFSIEDDGDGFVMLRLRLPIDEQSRQALIDRQELPYRAKGIEADRAMTSFMVQCYERMQEVSK